MVKDQSRICQGSPREWQERAEPVPFVMKNVERRVFVVHSRNAIAEFWTVRTIVWRRGSNSVPV